MKGRDHGTRPLPIASDTVDAHECAGRAYKRVSAGLDQRSEPSFYPPMPSSTAPEKARLTLGLWASHLPQLLQCRGLQACTTLPPHPAEESLFQ